MIPPLAALNREARRAAILQLERNNKNWPPTLVQVPEKDWPASSVEDRRRIEVWRSSDFLMQVFDESPRGEQQVLRLTVNRTHVDPVSFRWLDGITWDQLQDLKRQCGRGHLEAVEIYPPDADVVNVGSLRHLWVISGRMYFSWRKSAPMAYCPRCEQGQQTTDNGSTCAVCKLVLP